MYVFWANLYKTPIVLKRLACLTKSPNLVSIKPTLNKIPLNRFWLCCNNYCFWLWFVLDGDKKMVFCSSSLNKCFFFVCEISTCKSQWVK